MGALIVYTVFLPSLPIIRQLLSSAVGVAAGIALVYWVAKTVSVPLALVVLVAVVRSSSSVLREHMEDCKDCPMDYTYDESKKMCTKEGAASLPPICPPSAKPMSPTGATGPK